MWFLKLINSLIKIEFLLDFFVQFGEPELGLVSRFVDSSRNQR